MKKFPKPWHRTGRGWFVQLGGKQISLGADEAEAHRLYHEIMAKGVPAPVPRRASDPSVLEVLDKFVTYCRNNKAPQTTDWYQKHLKSFLDFLGKEKAMPVADLCPDHVQKWCDEHPTWSPTTKRGRNKGPRRWLESC